MQGRIQDFKLGEGALGGAKIFGVFRVNVMLTAAVQNFSEGFHCSLLIKLILLCTGVVVVLIVW
jgi:hypothetical protein